MEVTVKQFIAKVSTLLKKANSGDEIVITFHGKPYAKVITIGAKVITKDKKVSTLPVKNVVTIDNVSTLVNKISTYGCGCDREQGKSLCTKHNRL